MAKKKTLQKQTKSSKKDMSFIERTCAPDEEVLIISRMHWFFLFVGLGWFLLLVIAGAGINEIIWTYLESSIPAYDRTIFGIQLNSRGIILQWFFTGLGALIFLHYCLTYYTTKVALTDKRVIIRRGFIVVKVRELDLDEIKSEHVRHGLFGRFLDYGEIHFDARFVGDVSVPDIAQPYRFLRACHEARAEIIESMFADPSTAKAIGP
jgi:hypothetical protein